MEIRIAKVTDREAVRSVYLSAFGEGEREIVSELAVKLLTEETTPATVSLVAEAEEVVVGHVAFSPVTMGIKKNFKGFILAPLAVRPDHQKQRVGSQLVEDGIQRLSGIGVDIVFVYGDPNYYGRFDFTTAAAEPYAPPYKLQYPFGWQAIALDKNTTAATSGQLACVTPLCNPVLW